MHSQLSGGKTKTQGAGAEQNHCPQEVYSSGYQPGQRGVRRATRGSPSSRHARSPCSHTLNYLQVTALPSPAHAFKCSIHGTIRCRRITPQDRFSPFVYGPPHRPFRSLAIAMVFASCLSFRGLAVVVPCSYGSLCDIPIFSHYTLRIWPPHTRLPSALCLYL
ncbi:hypothetical protein L226DRAFT_533776, partial [Lentinus tigrinus ALCF2SS1-7]|uniref:uncharacterized protein n=1 Tax=Lentinus tigrinus ALCF2SS1-7 TaxID=1328758 RepID=UPI001165D7AB